MKKNRPPIIDVIESAVANLQRNEEKINELNVFPIPDGDTGSNMLATLLSAWDNINPDSQTDVEILQDFSRGALLGARGNSGVITSQIIKGLFEGVKKIGNFSYDRKELREILSESKKFAYNSVSNPTEGTILSVIKSLSENYDSKKKNFLEAFQQMHVIAVEATKNTPNQLEILKESGVVDSGAEGLTLMIEGVVKALEGKPLKIKSKGSSEEHKGKKEVFLKADPSKNIGYCTEFILTLKSPDKFDRKNFQNELEKIGGDSIVMIVEEDILKVHVHVKKPGEAFNLAQKYGEFSKVKSDNMASQADDAGHNVEGNVVKVNKKSKNNELAIIAVSNGVGIDKEFKELGVDYIVNGGQSMNPSVQDFMKLIDEIENENILILPNNSNIILTVETVIKNVENKKIHYLPTKTILQGIVALYNTNKEMIKFDDFKEGIIEEFQSIKEGEISKANRTVTMNGVEVKEGNYISISGKTVISSNKTLEGTLQEFLDKNINDEVEILTLFYNDDLSEKQLFDVKKVMKSFNEKYQDIEIEIKYGGQNVYTLLILGE